MRFMLTGNTVFYVRDKVIQSALNEATTFKWFIDFKSQAARNL